MKWIKEHLSASFGWDGYGEVSVFGLIIFEVFEEEWEDEHYISHIILLEIRFLKFVLNIGYSPTI